jgi:hypothetical protein
MLKKNISNKINQGMQKIGWLRDFFILKPNVHLLLHLPSEMEEPLTLLSPLSPQEEGSCQNKIQIHWNNLTGAF